MADDLRSSTPLRLRVPFYAMCLASLPAIALGIWFLTIGAGGAVMVVGVVVAVWMLAMSRLGATIRVDGITIHRPFGSRHIGWTEIVGFRAAAPNRRSTAIYVDTTSGAVYPVIGQPDPQYVKRAYGGRKRIAESVLTDLRNRHEVSS